MAKAKSNNSTNVGNFISERNKARRKGKKTSQGTSKNSRNRNKKSKRQYGKNKYRGQG